MARSKKRIDDEVMHYVPVDQITVQEPEPEPDEAHGPWFIQTRDSLKLRLATQIASHVVKDAKIVAHPTKAGWRQITNASPEEIAEIRAKLKQYMRGLREEMDVAYTAFISKNGLWAKGSKHPKPDQLTREERIKRLKAAGIDPTHTQTPAATPKGKGKGKGPNKAA